MKILHDAFCVFVFHAVILIELCVVPKPNKTIQVHIFTEQERYLEEWNEDPLMDFQFMEITYAIP